MEFLFDCPGGWGVGGLVKHVNTSCGECCGDRPGTMRAWGVLTWFGRPLQGRWKGDPEGGQDKGQGPSSEIGGGVPWQGNGMDFGLSGEIDGNGVHGE